MSFVNFAASALPTAEEWYETPIQAIPVTVMGEFSATADGACQVRLADGSVAYVKPRPNAARNLVVAQEKIASDLGHLLKFPVAPTVVRLPEPEAGWPHHSSMSLAVLAAGRPWGTGGGEHLLLAGPALESLRVFWTWIGDSDHNGHPQNLLYEVQTEKCAVVAIDHSHSLCHGNQENPLAVGISAGYGTGNRPDCRAACTGAVANILSLDRDIIVRIVSRLETILTVQEQERILRILDKRRVKLAQLFEV